MTNVLLKITAFLGSGSRKLVHRAKFAGRDVAVMVPRANFTLKQDRMVMMKAIGSKHLQQLIFGVRVQHSPLGPNPSPAASLSFPACPAHHTHYKLGLGLFTLCPDRVLFCDSVCLYERDVFLLVTELAQLGSVVDLVDTLEFSGRSLSHRDVDEIMEGVRSGVEELNALGLRHGDLHPRNVLVFSYAPILAKLGDFGECVEGATESAELERFERELRELV